ncbi:MAG: ABC transporter permease subunit [Pseudomonadota bacterium]|jgi:ABC-2 type transport system permease protein
MIWTIATKELKSLFGSPLAWITLAILQFILAWLFLAQIDAFLAVQPQLAQLANPPGATEVITVPLFGAAAIVLLMVTPLFSMRLIAEERRNQTLPLLMSAPVSLGHIVVGKFLGLMLFLGLVIGLTATMALSLYSGGTLDLGLVLANLLGLGLLAAAFAAAGIYFSSLTAHPAVAAIACLGALLGSWIVAIPAQEPDSALHYLSLLKHFESFNKGLVDTGDVAYFLLVAVAFLVLAVRRLDMDRLQG